MKRIAILLSVIAASSAALAIYDNDTVLGFHALYDSSSTSGNIAIGESAGQEIYDGYNNIIIGNESLFDTHYCYNNIIIGNNIANSANNLRNCINIGGWLNNGRLMDDSVILGDSFFSTKQGGGIFGIGYDNSMSLTNSIIYYKFGTLYFNAKEVVGLPSAGGGYYTGYDLYLSPLGRDDNSGTDAAHPLRTFDACIAKARTNATVCVMAGEYRFPKSFTNWPYEYNQNEACQFIQTGGKIFKFIAVEGKEKTTLIGDEHEGTRTDFNYSSLAFDTNGYNILDGFTIRGLTNIGPEGTQESTSSKKNRPIASCVWFKNCAIENGSTNEYSVVIQRNWGGFQYVVFENTTVIGLHFDYKKLTNASPLFCYCYIINSQFIHCKYTTDKAGDNFKFSEGRLEVEDSVLDFDIPDTSNYRTASSGGSALFVNSTIRSTQKSTYNRWLGKTTADYTTWTNCYVIGDLDASFEATNGVRCIGATAYTNAYVDSELKPNDILCPAVRTDGTEDAGYFQSGLSGRKALDILNRAVTLVYDHDWSWTTLKVYKDGECIGTIDMGDAPANAPNLSLSAPRNMARTSSAPAVESQEEEEGTNGLCRINFTPSN